MPSESVSPETVHKAAQRLRALSDEIRIRLLLRLRKGEANVGALVAEFRIAQASMSKHLAILKAVGYVQNRREGAQSVYGIRDETVFDILKTTFDEVRNDHIALAKAMGGE